MPYSKLTLQLIQYVIYRTRHNSIFEQHGQNSNCLKVYSVQAKKHSHWGVKILKSRYIDNLLGGGDKRVLPDWGLMKTD